MAKKKEMKQVYLFDLDGTLADFSHRRKHLYGPKKDLDKFYTDCAGDSPMSHSITTLKLLHKAGGIILIVTGRREEIRKETEEWLKKYSVPYHEMLMRPVNDRRFNRDIKPEMLAKILTVYSKKEIVAVFEDMPETIEMWRTLGLEVFKIIK